MQGKAREAREREGLAEGKLGCDGFSPVKQPFGTMLKMRQPLEMLELE